MATSVSTTTGRSHLAVRAAVSTATLCAALLAVTACVAAASAALAFSSRQGSVEIYTTQHCNNVSADPHLRCPAQCLVVPRAAAGLPSALRREIRDLSSIEWRRIANAFNVLHLATADEDGTTGRIPKCRAEFLVLLLNINHSRGSGGSVTHDKDR